MPWIFVAGSLASVLLVGCRTLAPDALFREQARKHPGQVVWVRGVAPLLAMELSPEHRAVGGVIRYWAGGTERALRRALSAETQRWGPMDAVYRVARERRLWLAPTTGDVARLKQLLEARVPTIVLLDPGTFWGGAPDPYLITGFDSADHVFFGFRSDGSAVLLEASVFERAWKAAGHRWILILPAEGRAVPLSPAERFERGKFYEWQGQLTLALGEYQAAADSVPPHAAALVRMGNVWQRLGRADQAEAAYRAAIRSAPEMSQAYNNLAMLLADTSGRTEEAVKLARNALALDPANPRVLDTLGYALYRNGQTREAADVLERARGRARWLPPAVQAEIAVHLVRVHLANNDIHLAREVLREALQLDSNTVPADLRELLR